jgi:hypothetical protein
MFLPQPLQHFHITANHRGIPIVAAHQLDIRDVYRGPARAF